MDPVLKAAVAADVARSLLPYRPADEEDALRGACASTEALAALAAQVEALSSSVARKAELANVYHRDTVDSLLAAAAARASAELAATAARLAEAQEGAVAALRAEAANASRDVAARLADKLSLDAWPSELQRAALAAEDAAGRVLAQWKPPAKLQLAGLALPLARDFPGAEEARAAGLREYDVYRTGDALRVLLPR